MTCCTIHDPQGLVEISDHSKTLKCISGVQEIIDLGSIEQMG